MCVCGFLVLHFSQDCSVHTHIVYVCLPRGSPQTSAWSFRSQKYGRLGLFYIRYYLSILYSMLPNLWFIIQFNNIHVYIVKWRTHTDPHRPQVLVPVISRPVASCRKGVTTPLRGVRLWYIMVSLTSLGQILSCFHVTTILILSFWLCAVSPWPVIWTPWQATHTCIQMANIPKIFLSDHTFAILSYPWPIVSYQYHVYWNALPSFVHNPLPNDLSDFASVTYSLNWSSCPWTLCSGYWAM